jgi:hypothetical protein
VIQIVLFVDGFGSCGTDNGEQASTREVRLKRLGEQGKDRVLQLRGHNPDNFGPAGQRRNVPVSEVTHHIEHPSPGSVGYTRAAIEHATHRGFTDLGELGNFGKFGSHRLQAYAADGYSCKIFASLQQSCSTLQEYQT